MKFVAVLVFALGLTSGCIAGAEPARTEDGRGKKPNVLFILVDDMGWGDLASNGGAAVPTPHMDGLAREGTRFTQFYTASPICSASRCGFITGQFPARSRISSFLQTRDGAHRQVAPRRRTRCDGCTEVFRVWLRCRLRHLREPEARRAARTQDAAVKPCSQAHSFSSGIFWE